ncbi:hypothetical protein ScPMuIL_005458 [Solemya velum]
MTPRNSSGFNVKTIECELEVDDIPFLVLKMATGVYNTKSLVKNYVRYRPSYPQQLFEDIIQYCHEDPRSGDTLAVDLGCGTGLSTLPLSRHFQSVIGIDSSVEQLSRAPKSIDNTRFTVGDAENTGIASGSVDLVTVGTALHWMDTTKVQQEIRRVLRPNGTVAIYTLCGLNLENPEDNKALQHFLMVDLKDYWGVDFEYQLNILDKIEFPFDHRKKIYTRTIDDMSFDGLFGLLNTYSAVINLKQQNPESTLMEELKETLKMNKTDGQEQRIKQYIPIKMMMGKMKKCIRQQ